MNKIKLNYGLLVFLYAYLRQVDLSIDRARWGYWDDFRDYYSRQIKPLKIAMLLLKLSNLTLQERRIQLFINNPSATKRLWGYLYQFINRTCYLREIEVIYCCQLLCRFDKFLHADFSNYDFHNETLRIDTIRFNYNLLENKLWPKDLYRATRIEHFQQHDDNAVIKIGNFLRELSCQEISDLG